MQGALIGRGRLGILSQMSIENTQIIERFKRIRCDAQDLLINLNRTLVILLIDQLLGSSKELAGLLIPCSVRGLRTGERSPRVRHHQRNEQGENSLQSPRKGFRSPHSESGRHPFAFYRERQARVCAASSASRIRRVWASGIRLHADACHATVQRIVAAVNRNLIGREFASTRERTHSLKDADCRFFRRLLQP